MKRKTVVQKKAEGTYRPDRDRGVKIDSLDKMPAPDPKLRLSKEATDLWYSYGNQLIINGLMTFLDLITFSRYCKMYDMALKMQQDIDENGPVQTTQSGYEQVRPCVSMLSGYNAEMLRIEDRFGLSPSSRAKIEAKPKDDNDELSNVLNG